MPVATEPIAEGNLMTEIKSLFSEFEEKQEKKNGEMLQKMDEMKCELREEIEEVKSKASSVKSGRDEQMERFYRITSSRALIRNQLKGS